MDSSILSFSCKVAKPQHFVAEMQPSQSAENAGKFGKTAILSHFRNKYASAMPTKNANVFAGLHDFSKLGTKLAGFVGKFHDSHFPQFTLSIERKGYTMKAEISKDGRTMTITLDVSPRESATGKSTVVATSGGNQPTTMQFDGKPIFVGVNAYVRK